LGGTGPRKARQKKVAADATGGDPVLTKEKEKEPTVEQIHKTDDPKVGAAGLTFAFLKKNLTGGRGKS